METVSSTFLTSKSAQWREIFNWEEFTGKKLESCIENVRKLCENTITIRQKQCEKWIHGETDEVENNAQLETEAAR